MLLIIFTKIGLVFSAMGLALFEVVFWSELWGVRVVI